MRILIFLCIVFVGMYGKTATVISQAEAREEIVKVLLENNIIQTPFPTDAEISNAVNLLIKLEHGGLSRNEIISELLTNNIPININISDIDLESFLDGLTIKKLFGKLSSFVMNAINTFICSYIINTQSNIQTQKQQTTQKIKTKKKELKNSLKEYKKSLEKKKKRLIEMLKLLRQIEALMKKNYVQRQNVVQQWDNAATLNAIPQ